MYRFNPTEEQKEIINTSESALVIAGPGTGKTRTAIEKAKVRVNKLGRDSKKEILFLSFSNSAILKLSKNVNIHFNKSDRQRLKLRTYHSCAAELVKLYGRFVGIPVKVKVIDTLEEKYLSIGRKWPRNKKHYKNKLFELARNEGLLGFDTLIPYANKVLNCSSTLLEIIQRKYSLILVDEFQDTSEEQWEMLKLLGDQTQTIAFGDPNQIIYSSLHSATEDRLEEFSKWKNIKPAKFSSKNFRCKKDDILNFADCVIEGKKFNVSEDSNVEINELSYRNQLRSSIALVWSKIKREVDQSKTICVLTPSNAIAEDLSRGLRNPPDSSRVSFSVYTNIAKDYAAHDSILLALGALRDYAIFRNEKTLNEAAIALLTFDLTWNTRKKYSDDKLESIATLLESIDDNNYTEFNTLLENLTAAENLKDHVYELLDGMNEVDFFSTTLKKIKSHGSLAVDQYIDSNKQLTLFDELRTSRTPKGLAGVEIGDGTTHILNYHKAKGREFDYVIMVVDPRGESSKTPINEQRRLYYVCFTRAKEWLGVLHYRGEKGRVLKSVI